MTTFIKTKEVLENTELYDDRELMFNVWDKHQELDSHTMPEVDLVLRILNLPTFTTCRQGTSISA